MRSAPETVWGQSAATAAPLNSSSVPLENQSLFPTSQLWSEAMHSSQGYFPRSFRGDSRQVSSKTENRDWIKGQASSRSTKQISNDSGLSEKAVENLRRGQNKIGFDALVDWCRSDPEFAAAFAEHIGLILPGEAEFAGALTRAFNAYQRRRA